MNYAEQLLTDDWNALRAKVLERDKYSCRHCNNEKYLNDPKLDVGFIKAKANKFEFSKWLHINTFAHDEKTYKVSNEQNDRIAEPCFLYFKTNDANWINIIACRHLTDLEISKYIDEPQMEINQYFQTKIKENGLISSNINSLIKFLQNEDSPELKGLLNPTLIQIKDDWTSFNWHYTKGLHVHHNYYQIGKLAWEYPLNAFTTLCWNCHEDLHESSKIEVRDINGDILEYRDCLLEMSWCWMVPRI